MDIRELTSGDADIYTSMYLQGVRQFPAAFLRTLEEVRATRFDATARMLDSGKITGAFLDNVLVGFAGLERHQLANTRHRALIGPFYVSAAYQGGGVAQALMDALVARARSDGMLQLELLVWAENARAIGFYKRNEFVQTGVMPRSVIIDGRECDDLFMVRALDR